MIVCPQQFLQFPFLELISEQAKQASEHKHVPWERLQSAQAKKNNVCFLLIHPSPLPIL